MAYTETKTTGYGTRVAGSFKNIGMGFIVFIAATVLLWWNEGRAVKTAKMLEEAAGVSVHVDDISRIDPQWEGQLVHINGQAVTSDILSDGTFGISENAIKLSRDVEYYQWQEHQKTETKEKIGGTKEETTTYTYSTDWSRSPINSSEFKDPEYKAKNRVITTFDDTDLLAEKVSVGAYTLNKRLVASISGAKAVTLNIPDSILLDLDTQIARLQKPDTAVSTKLTNVHVDGNTVYLGRNPSSPEVGDVRITFTEIPSDQPVSIIAKVKGDTFESYQAKNGKEFSSLHNGTVTMDEMFQSAEAGNSFMTWALRIVGLLLVCFGLKMIFEILSMLLKVLPFLANIMNWGVSLICNVIGFVWTLLIIALAWIFYRPIVAIILLAIVIAVGYFFVTKGKSKKAAEA